MSSTEEEKEGTPTAQLWEAAAQGSLEQVQKLLEAGADICEGNADGMTPLMLAAQSGHAPVVRALLQAGAPWNALNPSGRCAGDYAMEAGHQEAFDALLDAGKFLFSSSVALSVLLWNLSLPFLLQSLTVHAVPSFVSLSLETKLLQINKIPLDLQQHLFKCKLVIALM
jgi:ankyrin repeat protein